LIKNSQPFVKKNGKCQVALGGDFQLILYTTVGVVVLFSFATFADVRHSPSFFVIYMDVLIDRLRTFGLGRLLDGELFGCVVYVADVLLLSYSAGAMRHSAHGACKLFAVDFDIELNSSKSVFEGAFASH